VLPCAEYYKRQGFPLKKIVKYAANRDYSDLLVFNEDRKEVRQRGVNFERQGPRHRGRRCFTNRQGMERQAREGGHGICHLAHSPLNMWIATASGVPLKKVVKYESNRTTVTCCLPAVLLCHPAAGECCAARAPP
jgi:hypothetical protein